MDNFKVKVKKTVSFTDTLIKVVTFLSFILFASTFYIYHYKAGEIFKNQSALCDAVWSQGMTETNPLKNPIHESFLTFKNNCFNNASLTAKLWGQIAFIALDITIILPVVYFGGKKVVRDSAEKIKKTYSFI